jgi:anti-anti-sigma regulatory factor
MNLTVEQTQGKVPVTILGLHGDLDASNYQEVIAKAQAIYNAGGRYLLLDMSAVPFMGSSGLVALHAVAVLMRGDKPADPASGWDAIHAIDRDRESGMQKHVKLLAPQQQVDRVLDRTGLKQYFEIHSDRETAMASFG